MERDYAPLLTNGIRSKPVAIPQVTPIRPQKPNNADIIGRRFCVQASEMKLAAEATKMPFGKPPSIYIHGCEALMSRGMKGQDG